jgi:hypothetical protein
MEEKISSLLSSPDAMDKIMSVARSLGLGAPPGGEGAQHSEYGGVPGPEGKSTPVPDFAPNSLDPKLVGMLGRLMSEYGRSDDQKANLLLALKPFLKSERAAKIDRAVQIARLSRVVKAAYHSLKGGEGNV